MKERHHNEISRKISLSAEWKAVSASASSVAGLQPLSNRRRVKSDKSRRTREEAKSTASTPLRPSLYSSCCSRVRLSLASHRSHWWKAMELQGYILHDSIHKNVGGWRRWCPRRKQRKQLYTLTSDRTLLTISILDKRWLDANGLIVRTNLLTR